jgi:hypothetical protein
MAYTDYAFTLSEAEKNIVLEIAHVDCELDQALIRNNERKEKIWKTLANRYNFDIEKDIAKINNTSGILFVTKKENKE